MAEGDYQQASRLQKWILKQLPLEQEQVTQYSTQEIRVLEQSYLEVNQGPDNWIPTEEQLERTEQYLQKYPKLQEAYEQSPNTTIYTIDKIYQKSLAAEQTPEVAQEQSNAPTLEQQLQAEIAKRVQKKQTPEVVSERSDRPTPEQLQEEIARRAQEKQTPVSENVEVETPISRDSVIFGPESSSNLSVSVSDTVDPITAAIREEIIKKQQQLLQTEIANGMEDGPEKENFKKQDLTALRAYLATEEGKEAAAKVMKTPEMQTKMHAIEQTGYKAVHSQFQDRFRNVDWGTGANKARTTNIKNENGEDVCSLKETTIDTAPTSLMLEDGTTRTVKSYRQIDFPKGLEADHGPLHLSMALKDENGRNMPESNAVYFTAHYDESGKLTEVSSPVPVKFMGEGPDAIGYIERNGKVYTLPVTQGKYHEMMQEVSKNHGMNVDISQTMEATQELSRDQVVTPSQHSGEEVAQTPEVVNERSDRPTPEQLQEEIARRAQKKQTPEVVNERSNRPTPEQLQEEIARRAQKKQTPEVVSERSDRPTPEQLQEEIAKRAQKKPTPKPEQPKPMTLFDEIRKVAQGRVHANGNLVPSNVVQRVQAIRNNVEGKPKQAKVARVQSQEIEVSVQATDMLADKTVKQAQEIITRAAKEGKIDLVAAMVDAVSTTPPENNIPPVGRVKLSAAYTEAMASTKATPDKAQKARIERACGKIAEKIPSINHANRVSAKRAEVSR